MSDMIYRDTLIDWIMETFSDWCVGDVRRIVDYINGLPSAERKGEWIEDGDIDYPCVCSVCGTKQDIKAKFLFSFCPNCGARMVSE